MPLICFCFDLSTQKKVFFAFCFFKKLRIFFLMLSKLHSYHNLQMPSMSGRFFSKYSFQISSLIIFFKKLMQVFKSKNVQKMLTFFYNHKLLCTGNSTTTVISRITEFLFWIFVIWFRYCTIHIICFFFNIRISFITIGIWLLCNSFTLWGNKK